MGDPGSLGAEVRRRSSSVLLYVCLDVLNFFKTFKQKTLNLGLYFRLIL